MQKPQRAPVCSADPFEALDRAVVDDPHPFYARLRAAHPVSRVGETGVHLVANWALIEEALAREQDFSAHLTGVLVRGDGDQPECFPLPSAGGASVIATADEPDHAIHRALVQPRLAARCIADMEGRIREWARAGIDPFVAAGGGDFAPLSESVPALAVAHLLGLPETDVQRFRVWAMLGGDMLAGNIAPATLARLGSETGRMVEYLGGYLDAAMERVRGSAVEGIHSAPRADAPLLESLARGVASDRIDRQQAIGIAIVLFGAGGESTSALIGSGVRWLAEDPDLAATLREDETAIPRFVEEVVRLEPPFKFHYRSVRRRCRLGGFDLEPGDRLMLLWASANRDATIFEDPDSLRLDRRHPKKHLGFGRGNHFCIGAPLARLEARVVIEELLRRTRAITLRPGSLPEYANSIFIRRLEHLGIDVVASRAETPGAR